MIDLPSSEWLLFPPEWLKAALLLALLSEAVVIGVFVYLNQQTGKEYFRHWTAAWMFHVVFIAAAIGLQDGPGTPFLQVVSRAGLGLSALFMFWGAFELEGRGRAVRELGLAAVLLVLWSLAAVYLVPNPRWLTVPGFTLLAAASMYTARAYLAGRLFSHDARILGIGFALWGVHLAVLPLVEARPVLLAAGYVVSAALALVIAFGMVVEQQRKLAEQHYQTLFDAADEPLLLVHDTTGQIIEANVAAQLINGDGPGLVGRPAAEVWRQWSGVADGLANLPDRHGNLEHPAGRCLDLHVQRIHCPRGPVWLVRARDLTAQRRLQEYAETREWLLEQSRLAPLAGTLDRTMQRRLTGTPSRVRARA